MSNLIIAGVDEAGRGPLAGSVVAAAVILRPDKPVFGLSDSKKLSEKKREALYEPIFLSALAVGVGVVSHADIDRMNILQASLWAMKLAIENLKVKPDEIWVDGNQKIPGIANQKTFVGGDALHECIMAASIVAKVHRDRLMLEMAKTYPNYGFEQHKGYGTKSHLLALEQHGPCEIHRKTFAPVKNFIQIITLLIGLTGCSLCRNAETDEAITQCLKDMPKSSYRPPEGHKVYVSLTTSPGRLSKLPLVLDTLDWGLIDTAFLALPDQYKNKETYGSTQSLESRYPKLRVIRRLNDIGPIMKLIPAAQEIQAQGDSNATLITIDDDTGYARGMVSELVRESIEHNAVTTGGGVSSHVYGIQYWWPEGRQFKPEVNVVEGCTAIAYPIQYVDVPKLLKASLSGPGNSCKTSDDMVISWVLAKNHVARYSVKNRYLPGVVHFDWGSDENALNRGSGCTTGACDNGHRYQTCAEALSKEGL